MGANPSLVCGGSAVGVMGAGVDDAVADAGAAVVFSGALLSAAVASKEHSEEAIKAKINGIENVTGWSSRNGVGYGDC